MVRSVARGLRDDIHPDDRNRFDRIMRRTRIQILGKTTEMRRGRDRTVYTVPVLLECQDKVEADDLDSILRKSGYFCSFHWPQEVMEFVNKVRDSVREEGYSERDYFVKIRPEIRAGETRIKAEIKEKNGGRWQMAAVWQCPPMNRELWHMLEGIYKPVVVGRGGRNYARAANNAAGGR